MTQTQAQAEGFSLTGQALLLRDLIVSCHIGVTDRERASPQRLLLNLTARLLPRQPRHDDVGEVVDYGALARQVREACQSTSAKLLETLCAEIAAACFRTRESNAFTFGLRSWIATRTWRGLESSWSSRDQWGLRRRVSIVGE